jgi:quercetin dioxygenase-like cupin family protein
MTRPFIQRRTLENSHWYMGHLSSVLASTAHTDGALAVYELTLRPGMEPPPHLHQREDELIFMREGTLEGFSGETRLCAGPGELVVLPRNQPHGWTVTPGSDGKTAHGLVILVPGAMEGYFSRYSTPATTLALPELTDSAYAAQLARSRLYSRSQ